MSLLPWTELPEAHGLIQWNARVRIGDGFFNYFACQHRKSGRYGWSVASMSGAMVAELLVPTEFCESLDEARRLAQEDFNERVAESN